MVWSCYTNRENDIISGNKKKYFCDFPSKHYADIFEIFCRTVNSMALKTSFYKVVILVFSCQYNLFYSLDFIIAL